MELLVGETLLTRLEEKRSGQRRMDPGEVFRLFGEVLEGVACAHENQYVHCDLKPANIFLARDHEGEALALAGPQKVKQECRILDLGLMLREALTGQAPGNSMDTGRISHVCPGLPRAVELDDILGQACAKEVGERFRDAGSLLRKLQPIFDYYHQGLHLDPFVGPRPIREWDGGCFCGRDEDVQRLKERVEQMPLVMLEGPSGVGKSSLLNAGLIPLLQQQHWEVVRVALGIGLNPIRTLLSAMGGIAQDLQPEFQVSELGETLVTRIRQRGRKVLVCIDQLEVILRSERRERSEGGQEQNSFISLICNMGSDPQAGLHVLLVVRDDCVHLWQRAALPELEKVPYEVRLWEMKPDGLKRALEEPAQLRQHPFPEEIVKKVLFDLKPSRNKLLHLQVTGRRLWEHMREKGSISLSDYEGLGGMRKALNAYLEEIWVDLSIADRWRAKKIFLSLHGAGWQQKEWLLERVAGAEGLLEQLVKFGLLAQRDGGRGGQVALGHEALIHESKRLRRLYKKHAKDMRELHELRDAARLWNRNGRQGEYLVRGRRLKKLLAWRGHPMLKLDVTEQEFLQAARAASRRWRVFALSAGLGAFLALGLLVVSIQYLQFRGVAMQLRGFKLLNVLFQTRYPRWPWGMADLWSRATPPLDAYIATINLNESQCIKSLQQFFGPEDDWLLTLDRSTRKLCMWNIHGKLTQEIQDVEKVLLPPPGSTGPYFLAKFAGSAHVEARKATKGGTSHMVAEITSHQGNQEGWAFSPTGNGAVVWYEDGAAFVWREAGRFVELKGCALGKTPRFWFSPTGSYLLVSRDLDMGQRQLFKVELRALQGLGGLNLAESRDRSTR